jgi:biopolymer transport protein ExbD
MAFGTLDGDDDEVMSEINMTPLVDVMLVLLIIFIITIPVINHAVKIDLPRATNQPNDSKPQSINVSIDAQGKVFWNQQEVDDATLDQRIAEAALQQPQPELHLRATAKFATSASPRSWPRRSTAALARSGSLPNRSTRPVAQLCHRNKGTPRGALFSDRRLICSEPCSKTDAV